MQLEGSTVTIWFGHIVQAGIISESYQIKSPEKTMYPIRKQFLKQEELGTTGLWKIPSKSV